MIYHTAIGTSPLGAIELLLERYCGGALGTRVSMPKSVGCVVTKL